MIDHTDRFMIHGLVGIILACCALAAPAAGAVIGTTGTMVEETSPYPPAANATLFVFNEQHGVPFLAAQGLNFGSIPAGTLIASHYVQFDPVTPTGFVGMGSVTFTGEILGVITETNKLNANLGSETSDTYFGLADTLGAYPTGADPSARGLGSPEDDLIFTLGSKTLTVESLQVPVAGNIDAFRVFTAMLPGDINLDGFVNVIDLGILAAQWGTSGSPPHNADVSPPPNGDGTVNVADLGVVAANWTGSAGRSDLNGAVAVPIAPAGLAGLPILAGLAMRRR